ARPLRWVMKWSTPPRSDAREHELRVAHGRRSVVEETVRVAVTCEHRPGRITTDEHEEREPDPHWTTEGAVSNEVDVSQGAGRPIVYFGCPVPPGTRRTHAVNGTRV